MYKRKIYDKLLEWKKRAHGTTALLIEGVRRVGKSTLVAEFGRREFRSCVIVDFLKPNKKVVAALALWAAPAVARETVVFVCAHPDDLAGPSGTAILLAEKFDVHVIDYTHGEGGLDEAGFKDGSTKVKRTHEEEEACAVAGATLHWLDEPNGHPEWGVPCCSAGTGTCERLAALLDRLKPRAVILHWPIDTHPDHVMSVAATFRALSNIGRLAGGPNAPEIYFQEQTSQSKTFVPAYYVDITPVIDRKDELIRKYVCQDGEAIARRKREDAVFRGRRAGFEYAEAFGVMEGSVRNGRSIFTELRSTR